MDKIIFVPKELVLEIHNALELDAEGFSNPANFEFMFSEIESRLSPPRLKKQKDQRDSC